MPETVVKSQKISRDRLAEVFKDFATMKAFENISEDVSTTLPNAIDANVEAIERAQATADAANTKAEDALEQIAEVTAEATEALETATALALRDEPLDLPDQPTTGVILVDASAHNSFTLTLVASRSLGAPSGMPDGMLFNLAIRQDAIGSRALVFDPIYDFGAAGAPVLSTGSFAVDYVFGYYDQPTGRILCVFRKGGPAVVVSSGSFSAHNNGAAQAIPNAAATKLTFSTEAFDAGGYFATSTWTPPAGKPVMLIGNVLLTNAAGAAIYVMVYKNGAEYKRGNQIVAAAAAIEGAHVSCIDIPNGTDYYELWCFQNTGAPVNTFGAATLTYFQGTTITS